jgi:hypothetical protein
METVLKATKLIHHEYHINKNYLTFLSPRLLEKFYESETSLVMEDTVFFNLFLTNLAYSFITAYVAVHPGDKKFLLVWQNILKSESQHIRFKMNTLHSAFIGNCKAKCWK